ncbi:DUF4062 domain-containing protein [Stenotrophomonas geniculata]
MAKPRVFISSTCYDLASERDSLLDFCQSFGFDVVLSERGDVFFHPDLHTHDACVSEIGSCHILVLIVGGRFGGKYVSSPDKSITNAEYSAAKEQNLPVFTFIKQDVLQDHNLWQKNKSKEFAKEIIYPSIDNQEHAFEIFKFIDAIRLSKSNNAYFPFNLPREIHIQLRKQWASLFLEGLQSRAIDKKLGLTNESLGKLSAAAERIEELTKSMFISIDEMEAKSSISKTATQSDAKRMFSLISSRVDDSQFLSSLKTETLVRSNPEKWWDFLITGLYFKKSSATKPDGKKIKTLKYIASHDMIPVEKGLSKSDDADIDSIESSYAVFRSLPEAERRAICIEHTHFSPSIDTEIDRDDE